MFSSGSVEPDERIAHALVRLQPRLERQSVHRLARRGEERADVPARPHLVEQLKRFLMLPQLDEPSQDGIPLLDVEAVHAVEREAHAAKELRGGGGGRADAAGEACVAQMSALGGGHPVEHVLRVVQDAVCFGRWRGRQG